MEFLLLFYFLNNSKKIRIIILAAIRLNLILIGLYFGKLLKYNIFWALRVEALVIFIDIIDLGGDELLDLDEKSLKLSFFNFIKI